MPVSRFSVCALLLTVAASAQQKTSLSRVSPKEKSQMNTTEIKENAFRFTLPGRWSTEKSSDPSRWSYRAVDGRESLTVSLFVFANRLNNERQHQTIERMAKIIRGVQTKLPGVTAITMSETNFGESGGILAARFGGLEPARQRRFHDLLLCSPLAVTGFYYEAIGLSETEADARARRIMNSIVVPK